MNHKCKDAVKKYIQMLMADGIAFQQARFDVRKLKPMITVAERNALLRQIEKHCPDATLPPTPNF